MERLRAEEVATEQIRHRQWVTTLFVLGQKPAFEVRRPDVTGAQRSRKLTALDLKIPGRLRRASMRPLHFKFSPSALMAGAGVLDPLQVSALELLQLQ